LRINETYLPYLYDTTPYLVFKGTAGSGKSVFCAQKIVLRTVSEKGHRFLCIRKVAGTIEGSIWKELKSAIQSTGFADEFSYNQTRHVITHTPTGNEIICMGIDDPEKVKSIHKPTGIWIEEATELTQDDFNQLDTRVRGDLPHYKQVMLSFNPTDHRNWIKAYFFDATWPMLADHGGTSHIIERKIVETSWRDNPFLSDEDVVKLKIKGSTSANFHRVYFLGEWGVPEVANPFMHVFNDSFISDTIEVNTKLTLYVSFDLNVSPATATVHQYGHGFYYTLDEFRLLSGKDRVVSKSFTEELCEKIKLKYGGFHLRVTGDASAFSRKANARFTDYQIIQDVLKPAKMDFLHKNPTHGESNTLSNAILSRHPDRKIHRRCVYTIEDMRTIEYADGKILKPKDANAGHLLDTVRYMDSTYFGQYLDNYRK